MVIQNSNVSALAALGHDARLSIFRLLVKAGKPGLTIGVIGGHLNMAPSTLVHHLSKLVGAGLVLQEKRGREVFNHIDYMAINALIEFLMSECCIGVSADILEETP